MTAPLRRVLVYPPVPPSADVSWQEFGFLRPIDHALAVREHADLRRILQAAGAEVVSGEIDDPRLQDAIFPYDPMLTTDRGVILLRPGKRLRLGEVALGETTLNELGIPVAGRIEEPGTVEGGDTLWIDERTLAVGRGYRTNDAGIAQLAALLAEQGVDVLAYDLPHWHGRGEVLHLLSLISPVDEQLAAVYLPLMPTRLVQLLEARGWRFVEVPDEEFASQGPNVLALGPGRCLLLEENVVTAERLRAGLPGDDLRRPGDLAQPHRRADLPDAPAAAGDVRRSIERSRPWPIPLWSVRRT
jgi:N-dimethylarginine dimethylaminohydrolase